MEIAALNVKIKIQKKTAAKDSIGVHTLTWTDYFTCWATPGGESANETDTDGGTTVTEKISFTVRWCSKVDAVTSTGYRVIFNNNTYDITEVNHQNFKRKSVKLSCERVDR